MKKLLLLILTIILIGCAENGVSGVDDVYVPSNANPSALYTMMIGELGECNRADTYDKLMNNCPSASVNFEEWSCVSIDKISSVLDSKYVHNESVVQHVNSIVNHINHGLDDFSYSNINGSTHWIHTTRCN